MFTIMLAAFYFCTRLHTNQRFFFQEQGIFTNIIMGAAVNRIYDMQYAQLHAIMDAITNFTSTAAELMCDVSISL